MRRMVFIGALVALLVLPAVAAAGPNANNGDRARAVHDCRALKKSMGKAAFRATYGRPAMRNCVRQMTVEEHENRHNAAQECRAEREEIGVEAFREKYGTNRNGRNAFGKCVSSKRRAESREDRREIRNAAKECKAEREEIGAEAFREKYGTNENGRNAFGKCVSTKVKESEEEEPPTL